MNFIPLLNCVALDADSSFKKWKAILYRNVWILKCGKRLKGGEYFCKPLYILADYYLLRQRLHFCMSSPVYLITKGSLFFVFIYFFFLNHSSSQLVFHWQKSFGLDVSFNLQLTFNVIVWTCIQIWHWQSVNNFSVQPRFFFFSPLLWRNSCFRANGYFITENYCRVRACVCVCRTCGAQGEGVVCLRNRQTGACALSLPRGDGACILHLLSSVRLQLLSRSVTPCMRLGMFLCWIGNASETSQYTPSIFAIARMCHWGWKRSFSEIHWTSWTRSFPRKSGHPARSKVEGFHINLLTIN